jgi:hypothetical protein
VNLIQLLSIELGQSCNLGYAHTKCPNRHPERYTSVDTSQALDDEAIVTFVKRACSSGFGGLIAWHYYNEPLMQSERMFWLMARIISEASHKRFLLWTNGTKIPDDVSEFRAFEQIHVTAYGNIEVIQKANGLRSVCKSVHIHHNGFDGRLGGLGNESRLACLRPFTELVLDNYGNLHLCCHDWRGLASPGNIFKTPFNELMDRWHGMRQEICGSEIIAKAPEACRKCQMRSGSMSCFDEAAKQRAEAWREGIVRC